MKDMEVDVLAKYYPIWKENCDKSIAWLQDTAEQERFYRIHRSLIRPTAEEVAVKVEYYKKESARYQALIEQSLAALSTSEGESQ